MNETLINAIVSVVALLMSGLIGILISWLKKKLGVEKMKQIVAELENKQAIIDAVVLCVQQLYETLEGKEKYDKAFKLASKWLTEKGLEISANEIKVLIESSVKKMKKEFSEGWQEAIGDYGCEGTD